MSYCQSNYYPHSGCHQSCCHQQPPPPPHGYMPQYGMQPQSCWHPPPQMGHPPPHNCGTHGQQPYHYGHGPVHGPHMHGHPGHGHHANGFNQTVGSNKPMDTKAQRLGPQEEESERTKTIKDVVKRVAHLEKKRYKDEKEALKKEIKQLKQKDKRHRKRASSQENEQQRAREREYYENSAQHFMSVNQGQRPASERESLLQHDSVSAANNASFTQMTPGPIKADYIDNQHALFAQMQNQPQMGLQRQAYSLMHLHPGTAGHYAGQVIPPQQIFQDTQWQNIESLSTNSYQPQQSIGQTKMNSQSQQLLVDQFGRQYIVNVDNYIGSHDHQPGSTPQMIDQSPVPLDRLDPLLSSVHTAYTNQHHNTVSRQMANGQVNHYINDGSAHASKGMRPASEVRSEVAHSHSPQRDTTIIQSSLNQTGLSQQPLSFNSKRLSSQNTSIPNAVAITNQPQKVLYDPNQYILNSQGVLEKRITMTNQPRAENAYQLPDHLTKSTNYNSYDFRNDSTSVTQQPYMKNTMESTGPSGSTNQQQSFGYVLQNSSLLFPTAHNADNLSTLQHTSGHQIHPQPSQASPRYVAMTNGERTTADDSRTMLLLNNLQLGSPPTLVQGLSKVSTIQGVDANNESQKLAASQQSIYYADPNAMLSSQQLVYIDPSSGELNKYEPTILSDTLNQRAVDIQPLLLSASKGYDQAMSTPSICEIQRKDISGYDQTVTEQQLEIISDSQEIQLNVGLQKPPLQGQTTQKGPVFKMKELRKRSQSGQKRDKDSKRKRSRQESRDRQRDSKNSRKSSKSYKKRYGSQERTNSQSRQSDFVGPKQLNLVESTQTGKGLHSCDTHTQESESPVKILQVAVVEKQKIQNETYGGGMLLNHRRNQQSSQDLVMQSQSPQKESSKLNNEEITFTVTVPESLSQKQTIEQQIILSQVPQISSLNALESTSKSQIEDRKLEESKPFHAQKWREEVTSMTTHHSVDNFENQDKQEQQPMVQLQNKFAQLPQNTSFNYQQPPLDGNDTYDKKSVQQSLKYQQIHSSDDLNQQTEHAVDEGNLSHQRHGMEITDQQSCTHRSKQVLESQTFDSRFQKKHSQISVPDVQSQEIYGQNYEKRSQMTAENIEEPIIGHDRSSHIVTDGNNTIPVQVQCSESSRGRMHDDNYRNNYYQSDPTSQRNAPSHINIEEKATDFLMTENQNQMSSFDEQNQINRQVLESIQHLQQQFAILTMSKQNLQENLANIENPSSQSLNTRGDQNTVVSFQNHAGLNSAITPMQMQANLATFEIRESQSSQQTLQRAPQHHTNSEQQILPPKGISTKQIDPCQITKDHNSSRQSSTIIRDSQTYQGQMFNNLNEGYTGEVELTDATQMQNNVTVSNDSVRITLNASQRNTIHNDSDKKSQYNEEINYFRSSAEATETQIILNSEPQTTHENLNINQNVQEFKEDTQLTSFGQVNAQSFDNSTNQFRFSSGPIDPQQTLPAPPATNNDLAQDLIDGTSSSIYQAAGSHMKLLSKAHARQRDIDSNQMDKLASINSAQTFNQRENYYYNSSHKEETADKQSKVNCKTQLSMQDDRFVQNVPPMMNEYNDNPPADKNAKERQSAHFKRHQSHENIEKQIKKQKQTVQNKSDNKKDKKKSNDDEVVMKKNIAINYSISTEDYIREQSFQRSMRSFEHTISEQQIGSKPVSGRMKTANESECSLHSLGKSSTDQLLQSAQTAHLSLNDQRSLVSFKKKNNNSSPMVEAVVQVQEFSDYGYQNSEQQHLIEKQKQFAQPRQQTQEIVFQNTMKQTPQTSSNNNMNQTSQTANNSTLNEQNIKLKTDPSVVSHVRNLDGLNSRPSYVVENLPTHQSENIVENSFAVEQKDQNLQTFNANESEPAVMEQSQQYQAPQVYDKSQNKVLSVHLKKKIHNLSKENVQYTSLNQISSQTFSNQQLANQQQPRSDQVSTQYLNRSDSNGQELKTQTKSSMYNYSDKTGPNQSDKSEPRLNSNGQRSDQVTVGQNNDYGNNIFNSQLIDQQNIDQAKRNIVDQNKSLGRNHFKGGQYASTDGYNQLSKQGSHGPVGPYGIGQSFTNPETIGTEQPSNNNNMGCTVNFVTNINTLQPMTDELKSNHESFMKKSTGDYNQNLNHSVINQESQKLKDRLANRRKSLSREQSAERKKVMFQKQGGNSIPQQEYQHPQTEQISNQMTPVCSQDHLHSTQNIDPYQIQPNIEKKSARQAREMGTDTQFMMNSTLQDLTQDYSEQTSIQHVDQSHNYRRRKEQRSENDRQNNSQYRQSDRSAKSKRLKQPSQKTHENSNDTLTFQLHNSSETNQPRRQQYNQTSNILVQNDLDRQAQNTSYRVDSSDPNGTAEDDTPCKLELTQMTSEQLASSPQMLMNYQGKQANYTSNPQPDHIYICQNQYEKLQTMPEEQLTQNENERQKRFSIEDFKMNTQQMTCFNSQRRDDNNSLVRTSDLPAADTNKVISVNNYENPRIQSLVTSQRNDLQSPSSFHASVAANPLATKQSHTSQNRQRSITGIISIPEYPELGKNQEIVYRSYRQQEKQEKPKSQDNQNDPGNDQVERHFLEAFQSLKKDLHYQTNNSHNTVPNNNGTVPTNSMSLEQEPSYVHPNIISIEQRMNQEEQQMVQEKSFENTGHIGQVQPQVKPPVSIQQMLMPINVSCTQSNIASNRDSISSMRVPSLAMTQSQHCLSDNRKPIAVSTSEYETDPQVAFQASTSFNQIYDNQQTRGRNCGFIDSTIQQMQGGKSQENLADACYNGKQIVTKETFAIQSQLKTDGSKLLIDGSKLLSDGSRDPTSMMSESAIKQVALKGHIIDPRSSYSITNNTNSNIMDTSNQPVSDDYQIKQEVITNDTKSRDTRHHNIVPGHQPQRSQVIDGNDFILKQQEYWEYQDGRGLHLASDPASMQQTLEFANPESNNAPINIDTKTSIYDPTLKSQIMLHMRDKPISSSTISQSIGQSQNTVKQIPDGVIGSESQHDQKVPEHHLMSNKSATTTECRAFSSHMGTKDQYLKVSDQQSSQLTVSQFNKGAEPVIGVTRNSSIQRSNSKPSIVGKQSERNNFEAISSNASRVREMQGQNVVQETNRSLEESADEKENAQNTGNVQIIAAASAINFENIMIGFDEDQKSMPKSQQQPGLNNSQQQLINQSSSQCIARTEDPKKEPHAKQESFIIGQQTIYTPGQYKNIIMQYNKVKNEHAISNMEKSMERLAKKIKDKIGPNQQRSGSQSKKPPPISFNQFKTEDQQTQNQNQMMDARNKLHMLNQIPNPPPSHPTRGAVPQNLQHHPNFYGPDKSYSEIGLVVEKSQIHSSERSFQKIQSGMGHYWSHVSRGDIGHTMNVTACLSEMNRGNEAFFLMRNSQIQSQNSQIDQKKSAVENVSFNKDTESSQYDMEVFKQFAERQVQDFLTSNQPAINEEAQKLKQILDSRIIHSTSQHDDQSKAAFTKSQVSLMSASKMSMEQILESNRSLIREMQEQNKESSRHFSDLGGPN